MRDGVESEAGWAVVYVLRNNLTIAFCDVVETAGALVSLNLAGLPCERSRNVHSRTARRGTSCQMRRAPSPSYIPSIPPCQLAEGDRFGGDVSAGVVADGRFGKLVAFE
jgi:hypothetical protein